MFEYSLVKTFILINPIEVLHFSLFLCAEKKGVADRLVADPAVP